MYIAGGKSEKRSLRFSDSERSLEPTRPKGFMHRNTFFHHTLRLFSSLQVFSLHLPPHFFLYKDFNGNKKKKYKKIIPQ